MRPFVFNAPLPDDTAQLHGAVHLITPGATALEINNCHPPSGRFRQSLGKRQQERAVVGQRASRATGRRKQNCGACGMPGHKAGTCKLRTYKNA
jgi:hypothetical protein